MIIYEPIDFAQIAPKSGTSIIITKDGKAHNCVYAFGYYRSTEIDCIITVDWRRGLRLQLTNIAVYPFDEEKSKRVKYYFSAYSPINAFCIMDYNNTKTLYP